MNLVLATDAKIADSFSNDANTKFCKVNEIPDGWEGLDIGPETEKLFADVIKGSKTILWNGPAGVFEFDNFTHGSRAIGEAVVEATKNGAFSLVGGGDSVACVNKFGLAGGVSYVSTVVAHCSKPSKERFFRALPLLTNKYNFLLESRQSARCMLSSEAGCLILYYHEKDYSSPCASVRWLPYATHRNSLLHRVLLQLSSIR